MKNYLKNGLIFLIIVVFIVVLFETIISSKGFQTYEKSSRFTKLYYTKNDSSYFIFDSLLGYKVRPGKFFIPLNDTVFFEANHTLDYQRKTSDSLILCVPKILVLGGSFAYGTCVKDNETFSSKLQKDFLDYKVENLGSPGFGNIQGFLQLKEKIKHKEIPEIVVLTYASFHDERNVYSRSWAKNLNKENNSFSSFLIPSGKMKANKLFIKYNRFFYLGLPFIQESVLFNRIDDLLNRLMRGNSLAVSQEIVLETFKLCLQNNIKLVVMGLVLDDKTTSFIKFCKDNNIPALESPIDLSNLDNTCYPYDYHPNNRSHQIYADSLEAYIVKHFMKN